MCGITLLLERDGAALSLLDDERLSQDIETRLRQRGPDHFGSLDRAVGGWRVRLCSAVLHLRGDALTPQPLEDAQGNVLCWNGEVFGYEDAAGCAADLEHGNDTQWLSELLAHLSQSDLGDDEDKDDDDGDGLALTRRVVDALRRARGPFAVVWFHVASQRLFFAHDRFGRRSLLVHSDAQELLTSLATSSTSPEGVSVDAAALQRLVLSSVALSRDSIADPAMDFAEVPANGIYVLDLQRQRLAFHAYEPLPPLSNGATSGARAAATPIDVVSDRYDCGLPSLLPAVASDLDRAALGLLRALSNAVGVRVRTIPPNPRGAGAARVGVLFSGGLDSVVLAALAHFHVTDPHEPIDLLNVCFDKASQFQSPDRLAAQISYQELCGLYPTRRWRFVCVNEDYKRGVLDHQDELLGLLRPCDTHMDFNIGAAFWCLSRCHGFLLQSQQQPSERRDAVDLNAFLTQQGVQRAQREAEEAVQALRLFDTLEENSGFCPATKCRRKLKPGCPLGVCRLCCLKVQKALAKLHQETSSAEEQRASRLHLASMLPHAAEDAHARVEALVHVCSAHPETMLCRVHRSRQDNAGDNHEKNPDHGVAEGAHASSTMAPYTTSARVLLVGIGADEQLGGYGRHKTAFVEGGAEALQRELARDMARIWKRNLGRDDRCISAHAREARFPFLDEGVVQLIASLPLDAVCDFAQPRGRGDKLVLRVAAERLLGLTNCAQLAKRAIQFGSRIAKHANVAAFGSNRQASGDAKIRARRREPDEAEDE